MADGANALLYAIEGDYTNAGISAIAIVWGRGYNQTIKVGESGAKCIKFPRFRTGGIKMTEIKNFESLKQRQDKRFINKETHTIYELKPYNPNNVRRGIKQLERYKRILEESGNIKWKTVLDFY